jgi:hypothetical protein
MSRPGALTLSIAGGLALMITFQSLGLFASVQKMHEAVFLVNHPRLFEFPPLERAEGIQA